jgi:carbon monoxide dehydrogenase subunit G
MKSVRINSVGVEYPTNTTTISVDLIETTGKITRVTETLSLTIEGVYQNMTSELFDKVLLELSEAGFDVMSTDVAE